MLSELPIVATNVGGVPEVIGPTQQDTNHVGRLVPAADCKELANAISAAFNSPEEAADMTNRARLRALERFNVEQMVKSTLDVYWQAISSTPDARRVTTNEGRASEVDSLALAD